MENSDQKYNFYEIQNLRNPENIADIGRDSIGFYHSFGFDISKKGNLHFIEDEKIVYSSANSIVFENILTGEKDFLLSIDQGGIGCVAVHPSREYIAVGAIGFQPKIYIYTYPELQIYKVLSDGSERGFSCLSFNGPGETLASVSMSPDFMLTIWDWENERMWLHSKAFGQDIFNVQFSKDDPRRLTTSGVGHIRFWKMASTFTGLKLQGSIGKFGKIDLSDIESFVELPDGKVISGTEIGDLLLWEGNFIKCRFVIKGGKSCHTGTVTFLEFDRKEKCIITAATDGYIRWWDFSEIDSAEVDSDHSMDFELTLIAEYFIGKGHGIKTMVDSGSKKTSRVFVIADTNGRLQSISFRLAKESITKQEFLNSDSNISISSCMKSLDEYHKEKLFNAEEEAEFVVDDFDSFYVDRIVFNKYHSGPILGLDSCPIDYLAATCSSDGSVRCIDIKSKFIIGNRQFSTPACCLKWLPSNVNSDGKLFAVGFNDGTIRILGVGEELESEKVSPGLVQRAPKHEIIRKMVFKPHNDAVLDIVFNNEGSIVATSGKDGIIFFLDCRNIDDSTKTLRPICFVTVKPDDNQYSNEKVCGLKLNWSPNDSALLVTCSDGILREVGVSQLQDVLKNPTSEEEIISYEVFYPIEALSFRIPELKNVKSASSIALSSPTKTMNDPSKKEADKFVSVSGAKEDQGENIDSNGEAYEIKKSNTSEVISPSKSTKSINATSDPSQMIDLYIKNACYSLNRELGGILISASIGQTNYFFECKKFEEAPVKELMNGVYSLDGKNYLKNPAVNCLTYSWSKDFLLVGTSDGTSLVRPSDYIETFSRSITNNGYNIGGVAAVVTSFDDKYKVSVGFDGMLIINRLRLDLINERAMEVYKDLEAGIFGDELTKPVPKSIPSEPFYLFFVSQNKESPEDELFKSKVKEANLLDQKLLNPSDEIPDIGPNAYSIQDNRLKLEEDAKKRAAEELKERVRASVESLRKDYEKIVKENSLIPQEVRLTLEELCVDNEYFDMLKVEGQKMIDEVHKECAYDAEKSKRLLEKLKERYANNLLIEEMTLSAFGDTESDRTSIPFVKSLRTRSLNNNVNKILDQVRRNLKATELKEAQLRANEIAQKRAHDAMDEMKHRLHQKEEDEKNVFNGVQESKSTHDMGSFDEENGSSAEIRRAKRRERKEALKKHLEQKPNEDEDDIRDLNAIKLAEKTIGDYKLKCSVDYEVPEDQRINAYGKIRQMAMLEKGMLTMRLQFNERFLELRNLKKEIIYAVKRNNQRIREIDEALLQQELSKELWDPKLDPLEFPDDEDEVTKKELDLYIHERKDKPWANTEPPTHQIVTGNKTIVTKDSISGSYIAKVNKISIESVEDVTQTIKDESFLNIIPERSDPLKFYEDSNDLLSKSFGKLVLKGQPSLIQLENDIPVLNNARKAKYSRIHTKERTKLQEEMTLEKRTKLEFERKMIVLNQEKNINDFKEAIEDLRVERHALTADLKLAELKLITLYDELKLLQTFESRDNALQQKQIRCKGEEDEIRSLTDENKAKLDAKQEESQHWSEKINQIHNEFKALVPETHPYCETLTKIFKKKIKRGRSADDDNEDEEYEEDEEEDNEDDDDDDDEEVEDICPPGCEQTLYDKILELREKRLDTEEISSDIQKSIDDLKRTIERLKQREKQIIKETQQTEVEVKQFHLQKQTALNQIPVSVPVKLSQVFMFEGSGVMTKPTDMEPESQESNEDPEFTNTVNSIKNPHSRELVSNIEMKSHNLFSLSNLLKLKKRINELHEEINESKESFKLLHKERGSLTKQLESKEKDIELWGSRCRDLQMLKFGKEIDLDELEQVSDKVKELEAESSMKEETEKFDKKQFRFLKETDRLEDELSRVTAKNTRLLNELAKLSGEKLNITRELNSSNKVSAPTSKIQGLKEIEEEEKLKAFIKYQATELESLRAELNMLKRKEAPPILIQRPPAPPSFDDSLANQPSPFQKKPDLVLPPIPNNKKN